MLDVDGSWNVLTCRCVDDCVDVLTSVCGCPAVGMC